MKPKDPKTLLPLSPHVFEVLLSLSDRELHGYELVRDIRERTEGSVHLGTSTLYATLRRMLAMGIIEEAAGRSRGRSGGPPRRYYRITSFGRKVALLEARRAEKAARQARRRLLQGRSQGSLNTR